MASSGSWGNMLGTLDSRSAWSEIDNGDPEGSSLDEGPELEDGVPVATRTARPQVLFDEGVRQARAASPVGVDDVGVPACRANDLRAGDGDLQRPQRLGTRRVFQKYDDQTGGIALRFLAEGVVGDHRLPFRSSADEKVRFQRETARRLLLQQALELRTGAGTAAK